MEEKRVVLCFAFSLCVLCSFKLNTRSFVSACFNLKQRTQRKHKGQIQTIRLLMNEREQKTKLKWKGKWNARRSFSFVLLSLSFVFCSRASLFRLKRALHSVPSFHLPLNATKARAKQNEKKQSEKKKARTSFAFLSFHFLSFRFLREWRVSG